jgi:hypothetical protein
MSVCGLRRGRICFFIVFLAAYNYHVPSDEEEEYDR